MSESLISGYCYPPNSSDRKSAVLQIRYDDYQLIINDEVVKSGNVHDLTFSDRVGSINRKIFFASGTQFESSENDAIDQLLTTTGHVNSSSTSKLESSWTFTGIAVICTALLVFSFFKFGLPAASHYAAHRIPVSASEKLSEGALDLLGNFLFEESSTPEAKKAEITARFESYLTSIPDSGGFNYTLHFRSMNGIANAFALPSGDIVVTDELIKITTAKELDSVLLHEIGHVVERHGLEGVIKGTTIAILANIALGDLSTVAELTTGTATFLVQSSYTRAAEAEADDYALSQMESLNIDPIHFAGAMQKLQSQSTREIDENDDPGYLSSHPSSQSRIKKARQRSKAFNKRG